MMSLVPCPICLAWLPPHVLNGREMFRLLSFTDELSDYISILKLSLIMLSSFKTLFYLLISCFLSSYFYSSLIARKSWIPSEKVTSFYVIQIRLVTRHQSSLQERQLSSPKAPQVTWNDLLQSIFHLSDNQIISTCKCDFSKSFPPSREKIDKSQ